VSALAIAPTLPTFVAIDSDDEVISRRRKKKSVRQGVEREILFRGPRIPLNGVD
jgi:hypothetical protein